MFTTATKGSEVFKGYELGAAALETFFFLDQIVDFCVDGFERCVALN